MTGKSRRYSLEDICADLLGGARLEVGQDTVWFLALARRFGVLPVALRLQLLEMVRSSLESAQTEAAATEA